MGGRVQTMKKAFTLSLIQTIIVIVVVVAFGVVLTVGSKLGGKIEKRMIVDTIYKPVSIQDAMLSLMEMKNDDGIAFKKALVYAIYENTLEPKFYENGMLHSFDISSVAKQYLDYVYAGKKYWLFLYKDGEIITIARTGSDEDFDRAPYGARDSIPLKPENYWLVLYVAD